MPVLVANIETIFIINKKTTSSNESFQHSFIYDEIPLSLKKCDIIDAAVFSSQQNIFKLLTDTGTILLLKAESEQLMLQWLQVIRKFNKVLRPFQGSRSIRNVKPPHRSVLCWPSLGGHIFGPPSMSPKVRTLFEDLIICIKLLP